MHGYNNKILMERKIYVTVFNKQIKHGFEGNMAVYRLLMKDSALNLKEKTHNIGFATFKLPASTKTLL